MNFKSWFILSEELYLQNNTATIFHRTKSIEYVQQMMNGGFTAGGGAFHGPGLYTTYTLEGTTNLNYGPYVVKLKVKNLKEYFVLEPDVAKQIHGNNWKLKDQARILELTLNLTDEQWQKYQEISENGKFGSAAASKALKDDGHFLWQHKCKGIVYNGEQDGKCICVYAPYEGLQFLAYAHAPTPTTVDYIEKNWIKYSKDVSIKSISDLKFPKDTGIGSTSVEKQYEIEKEKNIPSEILNQIYDDFRIGKYVKLKFYLSRNKLSDEDIHGLFMRLKNDPNLFMRLKAGTTIIDMLETMANLIIKHKTELSAHNVIVLLSTASDKEKMLEILGPDNINKLSGVYVAQLLTTAYDIEKMARILGPDNINKLTGDLVAHLLRNAFDKDQIARILRQANINKLTNVYIFDLLNDASNKEKMAEILGSDNINKLIDASVNNLLRNASDKNEMINLIIKYKTELSGGNVNSLLLHADDKEKMVEILGSENINNIDDDDVWDLLYYASDREKMAEILGQKNIDKLHHKNILYLLLKARDKEKMAEILGQKNIDKLDRNDISFLLSRASDKEKMAEILGSDNINKLNSEDVYHLLDNASSKEEMKEMKQILRKYYTGKDPKVISLLNL